MENLKKQLLYNDTATFKYFKDTEDKCINAINKLTLIAEGTIKDGVITDYSAFLKNPEKWLTDTYWNVWGSKYNPPHADKKSVYERSANVNLSSVRELTQLYNDTAKALGKYAPSVKGKVKRNVIEKKFDVFVPEHKEADFKAAMNLVKAIEKFQKSFPTAEQYHIQRFTNGVIADLKPSISHFRK